MKKSAGLLIIQDNKILLAHPTSARWEKTYSIPKGGLEPGETNRDAALRETLEEVGLNINKNMLSDEEYVINYRNKKGSLYKKVFFYIVKLNHNTLPEVFPKEMLQTEGVDWAGFLDIETAKEKVFWRFKEMLDFIK